MFRKVKEAEEGLASETLRSDYKQGGVFPKDIIWISIPGETPHYCYRRDVLLQHFAESDLAWEGDAEGKAQTNARVFKIPHPDIWLTGNVRKELREFRGRRYLAEAVGTRTIVRKNLKDNEIQRSQVKAYRLFPYA